jgi:ELWxxDGT repeat protein
MPTPRLVKDINPGNPSSSPTWLTAVGDTLFFVADDGSNGEQLWRSNGTAPSTVPVTNGRAFIESPANLTALGNTLFFSANDGVYGTELWASRGSATSTVRLSDIYEGSFGSHPSSLTAVDRTLFFSADSSGSRVGRELFKSDGTPAGTNLVKNITVANASSNPTNFTPVGNTLFFVTSYSRPAIWKTDGTARGTIEVWDQNGGAGPNELTAVGSSLFFTAENSVDPFIRREVWRTDGTKTGTIQISNFRSIAQSRYGSDIQGTNPRNLTPIGRTVFFTAGDTNTGRELWKTGGTIASTVRVADIRPGSESSNPRDLTPVGNTLYFVAFDDSSGTELWKSDGSTAGTVRVADLAPGINSSSPENLLAHGNLLYFTADNGINGRELWMTDGTAAGTLPVADIRNGPFGSNPANLTAVGRNIYFTADNGSNGQELYFLDLTPPLLGSITVDGSRLVLGFSEPIQFSSSVADRFSVTVAGISRSVLATTAGPTSSDLLLTLDGPAPTSSQSVRVQYTDLTRNDDVLGVVQDRAGNDLASINPPGRAADTFRSAASVAALAATTSNLVLTGKNAINGTGNNLANTITGNGAANSLNGGAAADRLIGGGGNDRLTGGFGADVFRLDAALSSSNNRDTITDFNPSQGDRIELENGVFKGLTRTGSLTPTGFRSGRSFNSAAQRILYNPATGHLSYDSNGNASGGVSALIAVLTTKPTLTPSLFIVT